jgi:hypothetical protein
MAGIRDLSMLNEEEVRALPGLKTVRKIEAQFVQRSTPAAEFKAAQLTWIKSMKAPEVKQPAEKPIQGVKLTAATWTSFAPFTRAPLPPRK